MTQPHSPAEGMKTESFGIKFIDPQAVISQLEIRSGMKVADFGCGAGFFSLIIAEKIGKEGVVFALDILPEKVDAVQSRARNLGLSNVLAKRANLEDADGSQLPAESVDWVIIKDMLYQNKHKDKVLAEARRIIAAAGKILVIEWKTDDTSIGPQKDLRIGKEGLVALAQQNKLGVFKEIDAGDFHCGLILVK